MTWTQPRVDPRTGRRTDGSTDLDHLALLADLQAQFRALLVGADPDASVPGCGDWCVRDLVAHLAGVHHWAAGMALSDTHRDEIVDTDGHALPDLYAEHAAALHATLTRIGPDAPARTLVGPAPASFWHRRQVHETLVHLHDLRAAVAGAGSPAEPSTDVAVEVWADAVDEVATMLQPRQVRLGRMASLTRTVRLTASDVDGPGSASWILGAHEDGRTSDAEPVATATAPSRVLALVLWRRLTADETGIRVDGDRQAFEAALAAPIVP